MRFCVYKGITTLINLAYINRGHAQVVGTNLMQRKIYNLTMSYGRVLLDTLRHFLNYEKIITTPSLGYMPGVMMMWITRQVMK
jgi:hypothetical protein